VYLEMQRLFCMALMPGVCAYLGDVERAGTLYGLLLPYAARNALTPQELCFGSVARGLGLLAATRGEWEAAAAHFEAALELNDRMGARPWLAHTQHDYGRMLLRRDAPGDRDRAQELLASAKALAGELGMDALTARL
jgi:tetratricopeptide (TPR) repeat protein